MTDLQELFSCSSNLELLEQLQNSEPVMYRDNGNRAQEPAKYIEEIKEKLALCGITRCGEIGQLAQHGYPVYQTTRPKLIYHTWYGQNSGSQGKGPTQDQAKISALMESVEAYCAEPRIPMLRRASYDDLSQSDLCVSPHAFTRRYQPREEAPSLDEQLMWAKTLCIETQSEVYVPAESIFFPFIPRFYKTRSHFPCSSDGMASGSTYLEAVVHALYEKIERHYLGLCQLGVAEQVPINVEGLSCYKDHEQPEGEKTKAFAYLIPGIKNLPMIRVKSRSWGGMGCSATVDLSIIRAMSEAFQSEAIELSGSREDIAHQRAPQIFTKNSLSDGRKRKLEQPLSLSEYRASVVDEIFTDLRDEYNFLVNWIHEIGYPIICLANLTRTGIGVPVVKTIIPGMLFQTQSAWSDDIKDSHKPHRIGYPSIRTANK